ncbi:hypothetical protein [Paenibacillus roseipurpureus]|uniref:Uncharacterized protein n=1 Tax=Paenibacillus roseopurpureus TaxID=2918901 RepID=A0AA96LLV9_9BACL|nr:hypothetical protein [Paenibacillus sp. MBLB1832]WNR44145.1 hypothetical protein MJB10_24105 [Paenibacillus sp. MBLB1832]
MIWSLIILLMILLAMKVEIPKLRKKKLNKELWIFVGALAFAALYSMAVSLHLALPNPLDGVSYLFRPMGKMITTLLT